MEEDVIRRYVTGQLSGAELEAFERRLATDSAFQQEVEDFQSIRDGIRLSEYNRLKGKLVQMESKKTRTRSFRKYGIAASIALVLGLAGFYLWNQSASTPQALYAEYYEPYPNLYAPITRDGNEKNSLEEAFAHYELGKYQLALKGFNQALQKEVDHDVLFYKAMALILLNRDPEAQKVLSTVEKNRTNYYPQTLWYQSLLFLKEGNTNQARAQLKKLTTLKSGYKDEQVKSLLDELD